MTGGTEGCQFYAQYFDDSNQIKINFFGGDIEKLNSYTQTIEDAITPASLSFKDISVELDCRGRLGYTDIPEPEIECDF